MGALQHQHVIQQRMPLTSRENLEREAQYVPEEDEAAADLTVIGVDTELALLVLVDMAARSRATTTELCMSVVSFLCHRLGIEQVRRNYGTHSRIRALTKSYRLTGKSRTHTEYSVQRTGLRFATVSHSIFLSSTTIHYHSPSSVVQVRYEYILTLPQLALLFLSFPLTPVSACS
jgi:hypothetical protein